MSSDLDYESFFQSVGKSAPSQVKPNGGRPKFVKLVPRDKGEFLPEVFFEDPRQFQPKVGPLGQIHAWGLYPYNWTDGTPERGDEADNWPHFDGIQAMYRTMNYQYFYDDKTNPSPESQFMKVILENKRKQLKTVNLNGLEKCDILCKIKLTCMRNPKGQDRVWRRFRVSAGISLSTFQDKVISPIMGWVRNFHCYTFTDYRDGSLFGPEGMGAIDHMHIAQVGYDYLSDDKYKLAHLFGKEGDNIGYLYDFGDKWYHEIQILNIFPRDESTGEIKIVDGVGMCPGENQHGCINYETFLNEYDNDPPTEKWKKKNKILAEPNYKAVFAKAPTFFDPSYFDQQEAEERLTEALNSNQSIRVGPKKHSTPIGHNGEEHIDKLNMLGMKEGDRYEKKREDGGYWHETTSTTRDSIKKAVCASCGKPAAEDVELKKCSGCRIVMYCSPEHQKTHWKRVHKKTCSREFSS